MKSLCFTSASAVLNEAQARLLLVQAFVDEVVEKVEDETIRTEILEAAGSWLTQALSK